MFVLLGRGSFGGVEGGGGKWSNLCCSWRLPNCLVEELTSFLVDWGVCVEEGGLISRTLSLEGTPKPTLPIPCMSCVVRHLDGFRPILPCSNNRGQETRTVEFLLRVRRFWWRFVLNLG